MRYQATELEIIMREALLEHGFFFDEQVYVKKDKVHYEFDFVVYGDYCKVVVECDGPHHRRGDHWYKDLMRDLWTVTNDFQDVLRFDYYQLRNNILDCINLIRSSIIDLDRALFHDESRKVRINKEKEKIKNRKNSYFYIGDKPKSQYSGLRVEIPQKYTREELEEKRRKEWFEKFNKQIKSIEQFQKKKTPNVPIVETDKRKNIEEPIEVEKGIQIPEREIRFYNSMKNLSIEDKKLLWKMMKGVSKDGIYIYKWSKVYLQELLRLQLVEINKFYRSPNGEISLIILPYAPYLLKAYLGKN